MADEFRFPFEKLEVWHLAVDLAETVLSLLEAFPRNKYSRLVGQMEAAASSIAQNIAEGKGRQYKKEFIQFLYVAEEKQTDEIKKQAEIIDRKLHGLINSLRSRS
jgi:four helix bundle protein